MKQCLADVSETLKSALEKMLVFNEVNDVRAQQEKEVGIAERDIEVCAERFCASEQYRPEHQSDTGLLSSINDSIHGSMTFYLHLNSLAKVCSCCRCSEESSTKPTESTGRDQHSVSLQLLHFSLNVQTGKSCVNVVWYQ